MALPGWSDGRVAQLLHNLAALGAPKAAELKRALNSPTTMVATQAFVLAVLFTLWLEEPRLMTQPAPDLHFRAAIT